MLSRVEAIKILAGASRTENSQASAPTNIHMITGTVSETSEDGRSLILIDGLAYNADNTQTIAVDTLGGLEEGDTATILLTGEAGHAMTPIAIGSVGSIDRIVTRVSVIESDYVKADTIEASVAFIDALEAGDITAAQVEAAAAYIGQLTANSITAASLQADVAKVHSLSASDLSAATAYISDLSAGNLTASQVLADHATVGSLDTNYAHISNGVIDNAKIGYADVNNLSANYAQINLANVNTAQITNGVIQTASIVDEQVFTVTGNKATIASIDASKINVSNLNADNITVNKINGQTVTGKSISDALSQHETDISTKVDTTTFNNTVSGLNDRIDGAIETFTGTVVPTLNNAPASDWNTNTKKDQHVGDVYYVVNANSDQNGYCYRFTKSGSTYSWQLIKDSDVTAALSRLQTAEGKITTFDSDISTLKTDTGQLKIQTQNLETSLGDKVDVTTFNELSSDVSENSATISTLSQTVSQKADSSTVSTLSNTVNQVKQTADTNKSNITSLTQTVNQKADSSTVTTLTQRTSTIEQNLSGVTTRVGETEKAVETVSNPNLSPFFSMSKSDVYNATSNPDGYWKRILTNAQFTTYDMQVEHNGSGGWSHLAGNATSGNPFVRFEPMPIDTLKPSTKYTFVLEIDGTMNNSGDSVFQLTGGPSQSDTKDQFSSAVSKHTKTPGTYYVAATTVSSFTGVTGLARAYLQIYGTGTFDVYLRISLYEGEYSGPYKPYVDQMLSTRLKTAETAIDQNSDAIALKANAADTYTKAAANALLEVKANKATLTSEINASADTVKIAADRVNIEGAAIFSSGRLSQTSLNNAYDAKGAANTAESNAKNYADGLPSYKVMESNYSYTLAQWLAYAEEGAQDSWLSVKPVKVGDTVLIKGTNRDDGSAVYLLVTVDSVNSTGGITNATSHGLIDPTSGQRAVNNLQIGGRNLFALSNAVQGYIRTSSPYGEIVLTPTGPQHITSDFIPVSQGDIFTTQLWNPNLINNTVNSNRGVCWYDSSKAYISVQTGTGDANGARPTGVAHWSFTFNPAPANAAYARFGFIIGPSTNAIDPDIKIKVEMGNKPTDWTPAPEDVGDSIDAVYEKIRSQGLQLVTNGNGFMRDNTNWPKLTFDGSKANGSPGAFTKSVDSDTLVFSDEDFPLDVSKDYMFEFDAMSAGGTGVLYAFISEKDTDHNTIDAFNVMYYPNTLTTLASDLNPGDTTIKLTSATNFVSTTADHQRTLIFWDYKNSRGYAYPAETYSRNVAAYIYADDSKVNKSTGVITLKRAWTGEKKVAGTQVSQGHSGGTYNYLINNVRVPAEWTHYSTVISGLDTVKDGSDNKGKFRQGTAFGSIGFLWNYGGGSQGQIWVTNISVKEATSSLADTVKRTQRIWYRKAASGAPSAPSSWVSKADDGSNAWTKMHVAISSTEKYIYTCEQYEMADGTLGNTSILLDNTITVIDGGSIITNSVTANQLAANSVTADKLAANSLTLGKFKAEDKLLVDNSQVVVGGRNLLLGTKDWSTVSRSTTSGVTYSFDGTHDGCDVLKLTSTTTNSADTSFVSKFTVGIEADTYYTLSFWAKASAAITIWSFWYNPNQIDSVVSSEGATTTRNDGGIQTTLSTSWKRYWITWHIKSGVTTFPAYVIVARLGQSASIWLAGCMFEKANKASSWSPAPEDQTNYVDTLAESVDETINGENGLTQRLHSAEGVIESQGKTLTSTTDKANDTAQALKGFTDSVSQWLTFNGSEGMTIGDTSGNYQRLDSTSQRFYSDGIEVMRTEGGKVEAASMDADEVHVGEFMWVARSNGHTAFKWAKRN